MYTVRQRFVESRSELLLHGFELRNISVQVYISNLTICGLPLSVDDSAVIESLEKLNVSLKSEIKYEKIRHTVTHRMTSVLNGNRFLYVQLLPNKSSLPRIGYCAGLNCRLYHNEQETTSSQVQCFNCWGMGHRPSCKKRKRVECVRKKATNQGHLIASILNSHQKRLLSRGKTLLCPTFTPVKSKPLAKFTNLLNMHISSQKQ